MTRAAVVGAAVVLMVMLVALAGAAGVLAAPLQLGTPGRALMPVPLPAAEDIPADYLILYQRAAGRCPGLSWTVLAAIGKVESDHGRSTAPGVHSGANAAGAAGPMQMGIGTGAAGDAFWRFAVDGNGDGITSPYEPADAIPSAAAYLCRALRDHGKDLAAAVFAYNHADWYVRRVLALAETYGGLAAGPGMAAPRAVAFALDQVGTPYRWGGDGPHEGGFDCSGLTRAAYAAAGIRLPRVAQAQYDTGPHLPPGAPLAAGDLVFFGTGPRNVTHVGLVVGPGQMVDAPHTGALVRVEPSTRPTYLGATRPTALPGPAGPPRRP